MPGEYILSLFRQDWRRYLRRENYINYVYPAGLVFLLHVEVNGLIDFNFTVFHISYGSIFFYCRERIKVGSQPMLVQFPLDDGVIIPEDESIFRSLVLCDAEFGIHIVLHTMVVTVR